MSAFGLYVILEIIIVNQSGSPKAIVKIKCLDILIEYGFNPSKLIVIMVINSDEIDEDKPLRLMENVRLSC